MNNPMNRLEAKQRETRRENNREGLCVVSHSYSRGFTLVETIIAMAVIITGFLGVLALFSNIMSSFSMIRDGLVASSLAQEGIELARNARDNNWLSKPRRPWTEGVLNSGSCVDIDHATLFSCLSSELYFDDARGVFTHTVTASPTVFSRSVAATAVSTDELRVVATLSWSRRGIPFSFAVEEHLFNWR